jgi:hypothetical protein
MRKVNSRRVTGGASPSGCGKAMRSIGFPQAAIQCFAASRPGFRHRV